MRSAITLRHEFVEYIPKELDDRTLYVSMAFATVVHKCCCGCGQEVVTPLSPTDWKLIYDGQSISLEPSIGNWSFECQSHYWIRHSKVIWAPRWSQDRINAGRAHEAMAKQRYFHEDGTDDSGEPLAESHQSTVSSSGILRKLAEWLFRRRSCRNVNPE